MKLSAHGAGLPGKEVSFILCPLTPPTRRGSAGHVPVNVRSRNSQIGGQNSFIHPPEGGCQRREEFP